MSVAIIDYGSGNLHSAAKAFERAARDGGSARVIYLSAEQFTNQFVEALRQSGTPSFRRKYRDVELLLIDEMMTPDSSRYWPKDTYNPGGPQASFDKQYVRDYLESIKWNKQPPVPSLPDEVIARTREKYIEAFRLLSGRELQ